METKDVKLSITEASKILAEYLGWKYIGFNSPEITINHRTSRKFVRRLWLPS